MRIKGMLALVGAGAALAAGLATAAPAQAASSQAEAAVGAQAGSALLTPLRYYTTFYGPNPWWSCTQRGNQGVSNGEWYDFQCRAGDSWVDLYIQVAP
ncbi:hypothetical protein [Streptosporangium carneum]|uniref:Secreted protein n=1 Tax=Streptosporangium carneum TaxID=47481 RepID=A0A9W6I3K5_9ACTN|nr:hypothetical protein [Streptosporangium carneum]GLK10568.1 hypothetical protein GCM10017600_39740 [Streptosporangium carneum]